MIIIYNTYQREEAVDTNRQDVYNPNPNADPGPNPGPNPNADPNADPNPKNTDAEVKSIPDRTVASIRISRQAEAGE